MEGKWVCNKGMGKTVAIKTMNGKIDPTLLWMNFLFAAFMFIYTDDLHIIPSNEITMMETSSWYRRRSPCGISSNSWNAIPAKPQYTD